MNTLFLGDIAPYKKGYELFKTQDLEIVFGDVLHITNNRDFVCANLECALTDSEERIKKFGPNIKAPTETACVLKDFGVNLVGLSNNHSFDFGTEGIRDTMAALDNAGVDYTGFGENYEDSRKDYVFEKDGEKIAVIAVCEHEYSYALENRIGARPYDEYDTIEDIREAKKNADRVIVMDKGRIIAGENIFLEKKNNDIVIHCSPLPAPQSNQHGGFFKLEVMSENGAALACRISNCIFKLNGKLFSSSVLFNSNVQLFK